MSIALVTLEQARNRMNLNDADDVNTALTSALDEVYAILETDLDSRFTKGTQSDLFHVNTDLYWTSLPHGLAPLRLSYGFVDPDSVVITWFRTLGEAMRIENSASVGNYLLDVERGVVKVPASIVYPNDPDGVVEFSQDINYDRRFVRVEYDYGFDDGDDDRIPDWVRAAVLAKLPKTLQSKFPSEHASSGGVALVNEIENNAATIEANYVRRNIPFRFDPI